MDPFVAPTVTLIAIGGAVNTADYSTAVSTLKHTAFCRAQDLTSWLTDTCHANLIIDSVPERTCACLDHINNAGTITLILELEMLFVERRPIFVQFATKYS